jgi:pilus assembly protein Flp/PilA
MTVGRQQFHTVRHHPIFQGGEYYMLKLICFFQTMLSDVKREEGQTLVEYGLIIGLIAVALIAVLLLLTGSLSTIFSTVTSALKAA